MAYSVDDIGDILTMQTANYTADDGAEDLDWTVCGKNGTLNQDCDELKEGTLSARIEITVDPSTVSAFKIRFWLNTDKASGNMALMPYTDANSVDATNEVIQTYDTEDQWYEHEVGGAFIAQLADQGGGTFAVRLSASDGTAKSKLAEVNAEVTASVEYERALSDTATLSDGLTATVSFIRSFNDTMSLSDSLTIDRLRRRYLAKSISANFDQVSNVYNFSAKENNYDLTGKT